MHQYILHMALSYEEIRASLSKSGIKACMPHPGMQERLTRSSMHTVFAGGVLNPQPLTSSVLTPYGYKRLSDISMGDIIIQPGGGEDYISHYDLNGEADCIRLYTEDGRTAESALSHKWPIYLEGVGNIDVVGFELLEAWQTAVAQSRNPGIWLYRRGDAGELLRTRLIDVRDIGKREVVCIGVGSAGQSYITDGDLLTRNCGKAQPLDANVLGPKGFIKMGDLNAGDIICDPEGGVQTVLNVYDRGMREVWEFRTSQGTVECCREHLWTVVRRPFGRTLTLTAEEIAKDPSAYYILPLEYLCRGSGEGFQSGDPMPIEILSVRPTGRFEPMRCILVSSPSHLYITDHYIPTHNTFAAILMVAEPALDPNFRAAFTRRNLGNLKQGGGIVDDFRNAYGDYVSITTSDSPRVTFPSGAYVDCLHIADEAPDKLTERAKGWQYDVFYLDELTSYQFSTFSIIGTRARGKSGFSGHVFGTTNPKKSHWTRRMLDWYVGVDGFIIPERDGVVRWYFQPGDEVDDIVFGDTPEEVYEQCNYKIDRQLERLGGGESWTYKNLIRSFVFYSGKMAENITSVGNNPEYVGAVAAVGGRRAEQFIEGNFNVDEDEDNNAPIPGMTAQRVFTNSECRNGVRWITVDLADVGKDNMVALAWDGFHIEDILILGRSTPRINFEKIREFALNHGIGESHIIYDATNAAYMRDYMPDARPFVSGSSAIGLHALSCSRLKDECYLRLIDVICAGGMSISPSVAKRKYTHEGIKREMTVQIEWLDECSVVRLIEDRYGKKKLANKKEMNAMLGMGRSMDLLDPCAMRMYPVLSSQYGRELLDEQDRFASFSSTSTNTVNIYDETLWA